MHIKKKSTPCQHEMINLVFNFYKIKAACK